MNGLLCIAAALLVTGSLAGCGSARLFAAYPVSDTEVASDAPWPRLVDTPEAPAKGSYSTAVPDPAVGIAVATELTIAAEDAAERAKPLRDPVLTEAERRRLTRHR